MLTLRQRIFAASGMIVGLILVLFLGYYFFAGRQAPETAEEDEVINIVPESLIQNTDQVTPAAEETDAPVFSTQAPRERYARQIATIFVERFGSRSNQNDNGHIEDALGLVTSRMAVWMKTQQIASSDAYEGVTSDVVASRIRTISAATAVVEVEVQQRLERAGEQEIVQKRGTVNLIATGDDWKVDGFFWEQ